MNARLLFFIILLSIINIGVLAAETAYTDADVAKRIKQLQNEIVAAQNGDGSWSYAEYPVGITALALLALRSSQMDTGHPAVQAGLQYISSLTDEHVYSEALVLCALELFEHTTHRRRMEQALKFLIESQTGQGAWSYKTEHGRNYDHSNSQFAVLGLAAAERAGLTVPESTKKRALTHWKSAQNGDGGWGYRKGGGSSAAMTCAGIASLTSLGMPLDLPTTKCGVYQRSLPLEKGLKRLARFVRPEDLFQQRFPAYALYALERVGILMDIKQIGGIDWYRYGVSQLLGKIKYDDTAERAFALLFLAKGNAPLAITKWQWQGDWNNDHHDVKNWLLGMGERLGRKFDWTVDKLERLDSPAAKTSIIFVNGHGAFTANEQQLQFIRAFLKAGGTVVAEGCCGSRTFVNSFAKTFGNLLEPGRVLEFSPLAENHPLLSAYYQLKPKDISGYTLKSGCRNYRLVLLTRDISCALNGEAVSQEEKIRAQKVAGNLLVWALQKKDAEKKLDSVVLPEASPKAIEITLDQVRHKRANSALHLQQAFGRLKHHGDWQADPRFFASLEAAFRGHEAFPEFDGEIAVDPLSNDLFQVAFLFMNGHADPALKEDELISLQQYLSNGGFLLVSACCSDPLFDTGFRRCVKQMLPQDKLERIPLSDDIWHMIYDCRSKAAQGTPAYHEKFSNDWAPLYGIRRDGRWILVYSPTDFCCALEDDLAPDTIAYSKTAALQLIGNVLRYAFTAAGELAPSRETKP